MRHRLTLSRHISWRLASAIVLSFLGGILLITVLDFAQLAAWIRPGVLTFSDAALAALLRGPSLAYQLLPFATLFGAIATFVSLNRRNELTIARSAGVSAWQILTPAIAVAVLFGLAAISFYNPGAAALREASVSYGVGTRTASLASGGRVWLRQDGNDGPSIIGAAQTAEEGALLLDVTAFLFDRDDNFRARIDAAEARLMGNEWVFTEPQLSDLGAPTRRIDEYRLHTSLTLAQISESLVDPETVAFWRLPRLIAIADEASLPANQLRLRYHELLALPLLLSAMVLIAAVVSLRFSRTLKLGRLIVAGAGSGFLLYLLLEVSRNFGSGGVVPPAVAAWAPAVLAALVSVTILLNEEDG